MTPLSSNAAAAAAALSLTAIAAFLIHLTTKEDGIGFSKIFVYGIYAIIALQKKPHFLKLLREEPMPEAVVQMIKYAGGVVAGHSQLLVLALALKDIDASGRGTALGSAFLAFNLLLGAAFAVRSAFGILVKGAVKVPWRHETMRNDHPVSLVVKNTKKSPRGREGIPQYATPY